MGIIDFSHFSPLMIILIILLVVGYFVIRAVMGKRR